MWDLNLGREENRITQLYNCMSIRVTSEQKGQLKNTCFEHFYTIFFEFETLYIFLQSNDCCLLGAIILPIPPSVIHGIEAGIQQDVAWAEGASASVVELTQRKCQLECQIRGVQSLTCKEPCNQQDEAAYGHGEDEELMVQRAVLVRAHSGSSPKLMRLPWRNECIGIAPAGDAGALAGVRKTWARVGGVIFQVDIGMIRGVGGRPMIQMIGKLWINSKHHKT
ncbi:hypothetical protein FB451DRAFT_1191903 [Mycena latifolia]|nr:hypothetical protein FB451DRAFT_1191903 [Mycena latifolia]